MKSLKLDLSIDQTGSLLIMNPNDNSTLEKFHQENAAMMSSSSSRVVKINKIMPENNIKLADSGYDSKSSDYSNRKSLFKKWNTHKSSTKKIFLDSFLLEKPENRRISFAKFTENLGKLTKNAVNELKDSVKQSDFKEEYRKGLEKALNFLDINSSKNPFLKLFKTFIFFSIQLLIFIMNFISIVNLVLIYDYKLGDIESDSESTLKGIEWALGIFFTTEVILEIFFNYSGICSVISIIFSVGNIINMLLTLEITYSTIYVSNFKQRSWIFSIIGFLRSFKLIKLRKILEFNLKEFRKIIENNKINIEIISNEEEELKFSVIGSVVDILVGIFIEATALMTLNEILNYDAFQNPASFSYITAAYYAIVSLTTIGYGDVTPSRWESRIFVEIMLLFNISVLSTFLGSLTDRIRKLSPYVKNFSYREHVVIIGDIPLTFLQFLVEEINENDEVNGRLRFEKRTRTKFIIIGKDDPAKELEHWIHQFSAKERNGEAEYLKSNIMENKWFKQSNLQYAKHLFAFAINMKDSEAMAFEKDKQLAFNIQNIINHFPKLAITLTLTSEFEHNICKDSLWGNVQTVPFRLLNDFIMANSLENQGFNTWLVHLLTLREKKEPILREENKDGLMGDYAESMKQEIYPIRNLFNIYIIF